MRLNSNIYKNLFPEEMMDFEELQEQLDNIPSSFNGIRQDNHCFSVCDVLYKDKNGIYHKAIADSTEKSNVVGMVTEVQSNNVFTLMEVGVYDYMELPYKDTTILYLHDRIPGFICHYSYLKDKVYIPVAIYFRGKIILNIQTGFYGTELKPYSDMTIDFDTYSRQELDDVVEVIMNGTS